MEKEGLRLELARLTGTSETSSDTEVDKVLVDEANKEAIKQLFTLVNTTELKRFLEGTGRQLCVFLDSFQHGDSNLQFLRLSKGGSSKGRLWKDRMSEDDCVLPWEILKYHCKMASISQSFYRHISEDQWLRTAVFVERQSKIAKLFTLNKKNKKPVFEIRSNVVPKQAYLQRFEAVTANCSGNGCGGGFFQASAFDQLRAPLFETCTNCALVQQLRGRAKANCEKGQLWLLEDDVEMADKNARIGGGSEGQVHKVFWRHGIFARKSFLGKFSSFENERRVAYAVTHPNIVHIFGCTDYQVSHECSLFMELLEEDLESHLQDLDGKLISFSNVLHILLQVAEAMEHMHEMKFVHGDLKPGNILVSQLTMPHPDAKFYLVKVADFGNTQRVDPDSGAVKEFDFGIGTLHYTAPELLRHRKNTAETTPWTLREYLYLDRLDVYSYAVVAYQVLTGTTFSEFKQGWTRRGVIKPDSDPDQWRPHKNLEPSTLEPDRMELVELISKWWASEPESRPTFAEIIRTLKEIAGSLPSHS